MGRNADYLGRYANLRFFTTVVENGIAIQSVVSVGARWGKAMTTREELLACPCCQGKAYLRNVDDRDVSHLWIECEQCGIRTKDHYWLGNPLDTASKAAEVWNCRTTTQSIGLPELPKKFTNELSGLPLGAFEKGYNKAIDDYAAQAGAGDAIPAREWREAFVHVSQMRYMDAGMKIEQARIHAERDAGLAEVNLANQQAAIAERAAHQECGGGST